jgi:CRP-like cAMP-binding protein
MEHSIERKRRITLEGGETIFRQGDVGEEMYVVFSGAVRVFREQDGHETVLAELGPDDFLGEMALFDDRPRSANAVAVGATELRVISRETYELMACDPVIRTMLKTLTSRLRAMDDAFEKLSLEAESRREFMSDHLLHRDWLV